MPSVFFAKDCSRFFTTNVVQNDATQEILAPRLYVLDLVVASVPVLAIADKLVFVIARNE